MDNPGHKPLAVLLIVYVLASLIHFIHNAEFLPDYPNLPASWTAFGVYRAWFVLTVVGVSGWILVSRGFRVLGLPILAVYAVLGLGSLGHYVLAPFSAHTAAMNTTILLEVGAAALVLVQVVRQFSRQCSPGSNARRHRK